MKGRTRILHFSEPVVFGNTPIVRGLHPCPKCREAGKTTLALRNSGKCVTPTAVREYGNYFCKIHGTFGYQLLELGEDVILDFSKTSQFKEIL